MNNMIHFDRSRPKADHDEKLSFGKNIENARISCGLSRAELARRLGITLGGVSSWEYGRTRPDLSSIKKLCETLNVSCDSLLGIKTVCSDLSSEEKRLLKGYRQLPQKEKYYIDSILSLMNHAAEKIPATENRKPFPRQKLISMPLSSLSMCAGEGITLDYEGEPETIELIPCDLLKECDELVKVSGSSMEPMFYDGDIALVKHTDALNEGDIGVFVIDGEGMIKQYKKDGLHPLNKKYSIVHPDPFATFKCFGKVIGKVTEEMLP